MRRTLILVALFGSLVVTSPITAQGTWRITVNANGRPINTMAGYNGEPYAASLSHDGRFVTFASVRDNLVPGDTNGLKDVFVHDLELRTTTRVSVSSTGLQGDADSGGWAVNRGHSISADGRFVAFQSRARNLVHSEPRGGSRVYRHDLQTRTTIRIQPDPASGILLDAEQTRPSLSGDGARVAFIGDSRSAAGGTARAIFVHDLATGETVRVSENADGELANADVSFPTISTDGNFVTFDSEADNLVFDDTNGTTDVFLYDLRTRRIERVSINDLGEEGDGQSLNPSVSADGRYVAFESDAANLVPGDHANDDVFVRDRLLGRTEKVSVQVEFAGHLGCNLSDRGARSISADGRYVVFQSRTYNLVPGDWNLKTDVFVRDRAHGTHTRLSVDSAGNGVPEGGQTSFAGRTAAISGDGAWIAFESSSGDLVENDDNNKNDLFLRRQAPITLEQDYRLYAGLPAQFALHGAQPGETVYFLYSLTGLERRCNAASGSCIDLLDPILLLGSAVADPAGTARITATVPPATPSQTDVYTQAVVLRGPGRPDVVRSNTHHDRVQ